MDKVQARSNAPEPEAVEAFMARMPQPVLDRIAELTRRAAEAAQEINQIGREYEQLEAAVNVLMHDLVSEDVNDRHLPFEQACGLERLSHVMLYAARGLAIAGLCFEPGDQVADDGWKIARDALTEPLRRAG